jgi:hypothetical protein
MSGASVAHQWRILKQQFVAPLQGETAFYPDKSGASGGWIGFVGL